MRHKKEIFEHLGKALSHLKQQSDFDPETMRLEKLISDLKMKVERFF